MSLTDRQMALVRTSFQALRDDPQPRFAEFYDALFRHAPELRPMFRDEDMGGQGMRFMSTLAVIVDNLHHPEALEERYADLGAGHRAMGVKAEHFEPMGKALIDTLAESLGAKFTDETRQAWEAAYAEVSHTIISRGDIPEG